MRDDSDPFARRERNAARWEFAMLVLAGVSLALAQMGVI